MSHYVCLLIGSLLAILPSLKGEYNPPQSLIHDTDVNSISRIGFPSSSDDDFEVDFDSQRKEHLDVANPPSKPVRRLWGIPDTKAYISKAFVYPLPSDAFEGDVHEWKFADLPSWVSFSSVSRVLEGVARAEDAGTHYLTVEALSSSGDGARDSFAIHVLKPDVATSLEEAGCTSNEDLTVAKVILDQESPLKPKHKVKIINSMASFFKIDSKKLTLSLSDARSNAILDLEEGAILAGPGRLSASRRSQRAAKKQLVLGWNVGCGGEIRSPDADLLRQVASLAETGRLEDIVGLPIAGWFVVRLNPSSGRVKREAEHSGDYFDNIYDGDDDYNYDENFFLKGIKGKEEIPVHVSPTLVPSVDLASPVFKPVPLSTPVYIPVKPTRVVVEASPTISYKTEYPYDRFEPGLESSILTHPTTSADYTTPLLVTTTGVHFEPPRTRLPPVEATSVPPTAGETTEYAVKNFPPRIQNRIQKLAWVAGNVYRMRIPEDTFSDIEDGLTRNLTLVLKDESGHVFSRDSWIQFDPSKQEVYALPLEQHIGRYHFHLEAIDKDRMSVIDYLEVNVWQHRQGRNFHHKFTALFKMEKKYEYEFAYSLDWQVNAVEKVASLFGDSVSNLNVRNISSNPVQISWTNVSLVQSGPNFECPTQELEAVMEVMMSGHGSEPSRRAREVFMPEFQLKKIHAQFFAPCDAQFHHHGRHPHQEKHPISPPQEGGKGAVHENSKPIIRNQIDQLKAVAGHFFRYQVPDNTCYDMEDGNSRNLRMKILTMDLSDPPKTSWLQFDSANQEFFGLPLEDDVGRKEYMLECMDKGGMSMSDALVVEVKEDAAARSPPPVLFSLTVDASYDAFMASPFDKARLLQRLGRAFGDAGAENVAVRSLREGSVRLEWQNRTLSNYPCPSDEVLRLRQIMTDEQGHLRQEFRHKFLPDFNVTSGGAVIPSGSCLAGDTPTHPEEPETIPDEEEQKVAPTDGDYLLTFVVPAVIIAVMLLLAALIACCLYRRRRYGKMRMAGDRTFVSKGIPIIFAEELDDHRPEVAKSPVIMKEEKPPLPPPEYQRNSPPRADRPPSGDMNLSDDTPYHRPPPFNASNGGSRNQRPNLPPAYRKPPTYVPP